MAGPGGYELGPRPEDQARAASWPVLFVIRDTEKGHLMGRGIPQAHLICTGCAQSVICLAPDTRKTGYLLSAGEIAARTLAHIRLCHNAPPAPGV